jgi:hypothetical protein
LSPGRISLAGASREDNVKAHSYFVQDDAIPVDFLADPDGNWDWETLVGLAGFDPGEPLVWLGALAGRWRGHPPGSAVVTAPGARGRRLAIVECAALAARAA